MKFFSSFLLLVVVAAVAVHGQTPAAPKPFDLNDYGVRIEPDRRLIVVLAALEAAGLEVPLSELGTDFRRRMKADFAALNPDLKTRMRIFVDLYAKRVLNRRRQQLVAEQRPEAELNRFDQETKTFFEKLEKYRLGQLNEREQSEFRTANREFLTRITAPYISMAYTLGPVPDLNEPSRSIDLPDDLLEVLDFSPYVRQFYRAVIKVTENGSERSLTVGTRIDEYYKEYQTSGDAMRPSTIRMVRELVDYLHTRPQTYFIEKVRTEIKTGRKGNQTLARIEDRDRERRFFIVPDLLAASGTVNFRNIGDDYYAVVAPGVEINESEVRRAYLQFIFDPIVLRLGKEVSGFKDGIKVLLDERRKTNPELSPDVFLAVTRSLVVAADARQSYFAQLQAATAEARRGVAAGRKPMSETVDAQGRKVVQLTDELFLIDGRFVMPAAEDEMNFKLAEAYEKGAVLAFYFAQALRGLEDSEFDVSSSLRDIILSLDTTKEANRLAEVADARKRVIAAREVRRQKAAVIVENPLLKRLAAVEPLIKSQQYPLAESELRKLLVESPEEARIYYALGRVRALSAASITDPEKRNELVKEAKDWFTKILERRNDNIDRALISLTYVALARLYEYTDQNEYAIRIYEAAIALGDMKDGGFQEAVDARARLIKERDQ